MKASQCVDACPVGTLPISPKSCEFQTKVCVHPSKEIVQEADLETEQPKHETPALAIELLEAPTRHAASHSEQTKFDVKVKNIGTSTITGEELQSLACCSICYFESMQPTELLANCVSTVTFNVKPLLHNGALESRFEIKRNGDIKELLGRQITLEYPAMRDFIGIKGNFVDIGEVFNEDRLASTIIDVSVMSEQPFDPSKFQIAETVKDSRFLAEVDFSKLKKVVENRTYYSTFQLKFSLDPSQFTNGKFSHQFTLRYQSGAAELNLTGQVVDEWSLNSASMAKAIFIGERAIPSKFRLVNSQKRGFKINKVSVNNTNVVTALLTNDSELILKRDINVNTAGTLECELELEVEQNAEKKVLKFPCQLTIR